LAYVEWFTPFTARDPTLQMHWVSRSTRGGRPNAEVIELSHVIGGCHLVPKFGTEISPRWTSENVLE
ncbi:hypothetical protein GLOTRDRAFT_19326, partial [Gloeophyllum trabeum ATCC 11539]